ncbi:MAG: transposase, partial [Rhodospirillaceae bacterium]
TQMVARSYTTSWDAILLGDRLGKVRLLADAWYMRARLIRAALNRGHCVIGRVRKDLALYLEPPWPEPNRRGPRRKYGARITPDMVARLQVVRSGQILYGKFEVVRYRTCCVAARFLRGEVVRAVWIELERPDHPKGRTETRLLICTDPMMPALDVIRAYAKRWAVEPLFFALKHHWGLKDAWEQSRLVLIRWVTILAAGYAINQIMAYSDPALIGDLARPAPWRRKGEITAGIIRSGLDRLLRQVGVIGLVTMKSHQIDPANRSPGCPTNLADLTAA